MPLSPDWLAWEFWAKDTEGLNHLAVIVAGAIGIPLLAVRTFAANRSARAALGQAKAAAAQAKTAADRHEEQTRADLKRRITESFAKAVEQLGSDKLETKLGGIYMLERISQESERISQESEPEYWPIIETLTAYVREHAPWPPRQAFANPFVQLQVSGGDAMDGESISAKEPKVATEQTRGQIRPATDIQAILTVLGRRSKTARQQDKEAGRRLDLAAVDLRGADLAEAHLEGAQLLDAHLENAVLWRAHLEGAQLLDAHLENAKFRGAHLKGANLIEAHLEGAQLLDAHLENSVLWRAHLKNAVLWRAHLERAHLGGAHVEDAILWRAHVGGADLENADLLEAYLRDADISGAHLKEANLLGANLENANLGGANLENANLGGADLKNANLGGADLKNANLRGADLKNANLRGADLKGAKGLTQEQVDSACGDEETTLPASLTRPTHWSAATFGRNRPDETSERRNTG